ncbi:MerR family transcriptional regulator [Streptomyces youssoufiensis]
MDGVPRNRKGGVMGYTVGQVAGFAGVTVRTLHHYDEIGLLAPSARSRAGHRRYADADLDRLQRILFYRELGFPLDQVAALLDDPDADPRAHLRRQHGLLTARVDRLQAMVAAVERAMEARTLGIDLTPEEKFEVFGDHDPDAHAAEVERRWGQTEAYAQSRRRTAAYTKEDWLRIKEEEADWERRAVAVLRAGQPAGSPAAMDLAEEHRQRISRWYYDCSYGTHTALGEMYVTDPRFTATYEAVAPGLARYLRDAIVANAERHGGDGGCEGA